MPDDSRGLDSLAPFEYQLLSIAETKDELEEVDLETAGSAACMRFRLLRRLYVALCLELIMMVEGNGDQIREHLMLMLRDS